VVIIIIFLPSVSIPEGGLKIDENKLKGYDAQSVQSGTGLLLDYYYYYYLPRKTSGGCWSCTFYRLDVLSDAQPTTVSKHLRTTSDGTYRYCICQVPYSDRFLCHRNLS